MTNRGRYQGLRRLFGAKAGRASRRLHGAPDRPAGIPKPANADWAWRPDLWMAPRSVPQSSVVSEKTKLDDTVAVFHDAALAEITVRQDASNPDGPAPYGLSLRVATFDGAFVSVVVELPETALADLNKTYILCLQSVIEQSRGLTAFARLNVRHGPNTEQIVHDLNLQDRTVVVDFDLAATKLNEKRVETAWIDVIFEEPVDATIRLADLTVSRRRRARF